MKSSTSEEEEVEDLTSNSISLPIQTAEETPTPGAQAG